MRLISQDGTLDVPYEMVTVQRYGTTIYYLNTNLAEGELNGLTLGNYSTKEKATRAMEMLREKYLQYISLQGGESVFVEAVFQPNYWVLPKVFQFPQDDEIEV